MRTHFFRHPSAMRMGVPWAGIGLAFAAGLLANVGRKMVAQAASTGAQDWQKSLETEHKAVLKALDAVEETSADQTMKRQILLGKITHALAKHAFEEETVIYPALRAHGLVEGADELNHEHGYVKQHLYDLANLQSDSSEWMQTIGRLRTELESHMETEETQLYPQLQEKLSKDESRKLSLKLHKQGMMLA